ncbi:RtcB family protein [Lysinibacillus sp. MHQ-1]|nr:RtcB family protein [Lysinibacillus sp. MHQ-1]
MNMEDFKETMQGIWTTSVNEETLDEAPMAYKPMAEITSVIGETVDIIKVIKPVYNFKASEAAKPYERK